MNDQVIFAYPFTVDHFPVHAKFCTITPFPCNAILLLSESTDYMLLSDILFQWIPDFMELDSSSKSDVQVSSRHKISYDDEARRDGS